MRVFFVVFFVFLSTIQQQSSLICHIPLFISVWKEQDKTLLLTSESILNAHSVRLEPCRNYPPELKKTHKGEENLKPWTQLQTSPFTSGEWLFSIKGCLHFASVPQRSPWLRGNFVSEQAESNHSEADMQLVPLQISFIKCYTWPLLRFILCWVGILTGLKEQGKNCTYWGNQKHLKKSQWMATHMLKSWPFIFAAHTQLKMGTCRIMEAPVPARLIVKHNKCTGIRKSNLLQTEVPRHMGTKAGKGTTKKGLG